MGGVEIQAHTGVRHQHLGKADYAIEAQDGSQVQVQQGKIGITSYQAGVNVGKTVETANGVKIRPHAGVAYRHNNSSAKVAINGQELTQKFANEVKGQVGVSVGKGSWEVQLKADYAKNNESGEKKSALLGVNWKF
ncbi:outer membrane autotransporter barrel domain-containing protein [Alysiella filiformis DSM 16848]|uniref:Outer membrane autotransporter barrel domain-containing protein n=1 Tax=Alysiella filiformis DSM 16848 TaxID=1120981 RepID=A0A286EWF5_9NEIS|nr:outer membrane autotransporter barrel domain-containing protein [Alysiella filiformis DSM 16848]SOD75271.1 outer membrane autotransporter barrel domain-containing protein [Alysiella filiformis DSM 16848]